jgi:hypothetical protein
MPDSLAREMVQSADRKIMEIAKRTISQFPSPASALVYFFDAGNHAGIKKRTTSRSQIGTVHRDFDFKSELESSPKIRKALQARLLGQPYRPSTLPATH